MRLFATPALDADEREVLRMIDALRSEMSWIVSEPRRWFGSLRRMTLAKAVHGSNSVEGQRASLVSGKRRS